MSIVETFMGGYRSAEDLMTYAGQGTVTGRGLIGASETFSGPSANEVGLVRHAVTRRSAVHAFIKHIAEQDKDGSMLDALTIKECRLFHAPVHVYVADYHVEWSAAIGYDQPERYVDRGVTKSYLSTDWHPMKESHAGSASSFAYAGTEHASRIQTWPGLLDALKRCQPVDKSALLDLDVDPGLGSESAYRNIGQADVGNQVQQAIYDRLTGDRVRDCQWSYRAEVAHDVIYIPMCHIAFEIQGRSLTCLVDGWVLSNFCCDALPKVEKILTADEQAVEKKNARLGVTALALAILAGVVLESFIAVIATFVGVCVLVGIYEAIKDPSAHKAQKPKKQKKADILSQRLMEAEQFA